VWRRDVAEEIASQAFLELLRNVDGIEAGQLPAWLYTVVRNRAIDNWRRDKLESEFVESRAHAARGVEASIDWGILDHAGLNATHRLCLNLRYVHGMSREEIAEFTGLRENQVKGYLRYGLQLLRQALAGNRGRSQG
jgi:RNA polymerase sigma-70 factor (ECF subfamily)